MRPITRNCFGVTGLLLILSLFIAGCTGTGPAGSPASPQLPSAGGTGAALTQQVTLLPAFPSLIGVWKATGTEIGHKKNGGFYIANTTWFTITEQQGQAFFGTKEYKDNGGAMYENISGVMSDDGKKIYIAEHKGGYLIGDVIGPDEISLVFLQDGDDAAARVYHIVRQRT